MPQTNENETQDFKLKLIESVSRINKSTDFKNETINFLHLLNAEYKNSGIFEELYKKGFVGEKLVNAVAIVKVNAVVTNPEAINLKPTAANRLAEIKSENFWDHEKTLAQFYLGGLTNQTLLSAFNLAGYNTKYAVRPHNKTAVNEIADLKLRIKNRLKIFKNLVAFEAPLLLYGAKLYGQLIELREKEIKKQEYTGKSEQVLENKLEQKIESCRGFKPYANAFALVSKIYEENPKISREEAVKLGNTLYKVDPCIIEIVKAERKVNMLNSYLLNKTVVCEEVCEEYLKTKFDKYQAADYAFRIECMMQNLKADEYDEVGKYFLCKLADVNYPQTLKGFSFSENGDTTQINLPGNRHVFIKMDESLINLKYVGGLKSVTYACEYNPETKKTSYIKTVDDLTKQVKNNKKTLGQDIVVSYKRKNKEEDHTNIRKENKAISHIKA